MLAAMRAADNGLASVVIEKTEYYGASTTTSPALTFAMIAADHLAGGTEARDDDPAVDP